MQNRNYTFLIIVFSLILYSCNNDTKNSSFDNNSKSSQEKVNTIVPEEIKQVKEAEKIPDQVSLPKGLIKIPGYAFIDGRDLQAIPPLTISSINIWNSYNRTRVICKLSHGTKVKILNAKYNSQEGRYYLNIQNKNCEGSQVLNLVYFVLPAV